MFFSNSAQRTAAIQGFAGSKNVGLVFDKPFSADLFDRAIMLQAMNCLNKFPAPGRDPVIYWLGVS